MESFFIQPTSKTPRVFLDISTGKFEISGRSIPENAHEFYESIILFLEKYVSSKPSFTEIHMNLDYYNTSTSRCFIDIFRSCESLSEFSGAKVFWYYETEDEGMLEAGEDFSTITKIPFEFIKVD